MGKLARPCSILMKSVTDYTVRRGARHSQDVYMPIEQMQRARISSHIWAAQSKPREPAAIRDSSSAGAVVACLLACLLAHQVQVALVFGGSVAGFGRGHGACILLSHGNVDLQREAGHRHPRALARPEHS